MAFFLLHPLVILVAASGWPSRTAPCRTRLYIDTAHLICIAAFAAARVSPLLPGGSRSGAVVTAMALGNPDVSAVAIALAWAGAIGWTRLRSRLVPGLAALSLIATVAAVEGARLPSEAGPPDWSALAFVFSCGRPGVLVALGLRLSLTRIRGQVAYATSFSTWEALSSYSTGLRYPTNECRRSQL